MPSFSSIMVFAIGVFEFIAVAALLFGNDNDNIQKHKLFPSYFITDLKTKILLCTYLMTLGFQRVSWATGNRTVGSWLCLIGTHASEAIMFWSLALQPPFNKASLPFPQFLAALVQGKITDRFSTFVLLFVPILVVFFVLSGPGNKTKSASKRN